MCCHTAGPSKRRILKGTEFQSWAGRIINVLHLGWRSFATHGLRVLVISVLIAFCSQNAIAEDAVVAGFGQSLYSTSKPKPKKSTDVTYFDQQTSLDTNHVFRQVSGEPDDHLPDLLSDPQKLPDDLDNPVRRLSPAFAGNWWADRVRTTLRPQSQPVSISLESLLASALNYSAQIRVYCELPLIRETSVTELQAAFDPVSFVESRWDDLNDPVGNTLTTGGPNRYINRQLTSIAGLRQKTLVGGNLEVTQRLGMQDTNSNFFVPGQQGTMKFAITHTQPLLRGRGQTYNQSLIVLAQMDRDVAEGEFSSQLQTQLVEVCKAYWDLYGERSVWVQKRRSLQRAERILQMLKSRVEIDAVASQVQRAEAEVATRQSELIHSELAVQNAESRIRLLVNDPMLGTDDSLFELIPTDLPSEDQYHIDVQSSMVTAMENRPEVNQAIQQVKAGCVRSEMSKHELMPTLNLITETYVYGLRGDYSLGDAYLDQYRRGRPSYTVGLQFEVPLYNRQAKARNERRLIELRQLRNQYETTVKNLALEVEVAVTQLETAFNETLAQRRAVIAGRSQLEYLEKRWDFAPRENGNAILMLENLLMAQERLVRSEEAYVEACVAYNTALVSHRRATGELLRYHSIAWTDYVDEIDQLKTRQLYLSTPEGDAKTIAPTEDAAPVELPSPTARSHSKNRRSRSPGYSLDEEQVVAPTSLTTSDEGIEELSISNEPQRRIESAPSKATHRKTPWKTLFRRRNAP